jgi:predicted nucleotidyltransferase
MSMDPIPHEEIKKIIDAERERSRRGRARIERRLSDARTEAGRLAHRLAEADPAVRRVILFGSVATGRVRSERFDVDLAVEGGDHTQLLHEIRDGLAEGD